MRIIFLEDRNEGKDTVEEAARVRHQQLLPVHGQRRDEDLWGREAAPADDGRREDDAHHAPRGREEKHTPSNTHNHAHRAPRGREEKHTPSNIHNHAHRAPRGREEKHTPSNIHIKCCIIP